jgi:citrate synthase
VNPTQSSTQHGKARIIEEVMSSPVVVASPTETVADAAERMRERSVGSVVVSEDGAPIGILTERDLVRLCAQGVDPRSTKVSDWMTANPDTCDPSEDAVEAFDRFAQKGYRHIPVLRDGELIGILSLRDLMRIARIGPVDVPAIEVPKGLEGVPVADTTIGDVRGKEGFFHYRQYSAVELAEKRTLEDAWYLLHEGRLPESIDERRSFEDKIKSLRDIPEQLADVLPEVAGLTDRSQPLAALRSAYSLFASYEAFQPALDVPMEELRTQAMKSCAIFPTLVTALYRLSMGEKPVPSHPDLAHAANYLYMMKGEVPSETESRAVERYLMLTIDHGFNASTFSARVIASTGSDLGSAVIGAIGALSGPLHGGAPSRALDMLEEIGSPDRADEWLRDAVMSGKRLMGFGHRVYKTDDPRSLMLRGIAEQLDGDRIAFAKTVESKAVRILEELKPGRKLYPNVEFYAGAVLDFLGVPRALFTPTFAVSRVIGWTAHILEQLSDNRLIRPVANYVGLEPPEPVPTLDADGGAS